jgi:DeoR family glycerol-3-phosphate regulon repressor
MKYDRSAPVRIGHVSELDYFVTDRDPPAVLRNICRENHVTVEIAVPA